MIGRICRDVPRRAASRTSIFGYTCANDVTARDLQRADGQWARAKGFDTFCPLGPWIETEPRRSDLRLVTRRDGEVVPGRAHGRHGLRRRRPDLVRLGAFTLLPGDVILTGTPAGVGPVAAGQRVEVEIEGIGTLSNPFVRRD